MPYFFEWDVEKAKSNHQKHGVSFSEAASVFGDPLAALFDDPDHSGEESREIIIGHSDQGRLLIISFTERGEMMSDYQRPQRDVSREKRLRRKSLDW